MIVISYLHLTYKLMNVWHVCIFRYVKWAAKLLWL